MDRFEELKKIMDRIDSLDLKSAAVDDIRVLIRSMGRLRYFSAPRFLDKLHFYRGRNLYGNPNLPAHLSEISYPLPEHATSFQRANRPRSPMFYSSFQAGLSVAELRPAVGDYIILSEWESTGQLVFFMLGNDSSVSKKYGWAKQVEDVFPHDVTEAEIFLSRYLALKFMEAVAPGSEYLYKVSTAIAEEMWDVHMDFSNSHGPGSVLGGISYPSIAANGVDINFALFPSIVDSHLKIKRVEQIKIIDSTEPGILRYRSMRQGFVSDEDGSIGWPNDGKRFPHLMLSPAWIKPSDYALRQPYFLPRLPKLQYRSLHLSFRTYLFCKYERGSWLAGPLTD